MPPDVRDFLLRTSVLDGLTGSLCDAVTGRSDGQRMLERLERENLFLVAADDERRWFRYHHLFAAFLRSRLAEEGPDPTGDVHRRAADWYEASGHLAEAIGHALAAADYGRAVQLIRAAAQPAWSRGEVPTVLRWLQALPAEVKSSQPRLLLHEAMALALTGRSAEADRLAVESGPTTLTTDDDRISAGIAAAVRSWCARLGGRAADAIEYARRALSLLPEDEGGLRAFAAVCLGDSLWTTGDLAAAGEALAEAAQIGQAADHVYATLSAQTLLARVQIEQGHSQEAWSTLSEAQQFLTARGLGAGPAAAAMHIATGALRYESDDLDGAESALLTGVRLAELTGNVTDLTWGYVTLSRLRRARHDDRGALELAEKADRVARDYGADLEIAIATAWTVQLRLLRGELPETGPVGRRSGVHQDGNPAAARLLGRITAARVLSTTGRTREAAQLLDELREVAQAGGRTRDLVEILALRALVAASATSPRQAVSTMVDALTLADAEGYVRTLLDLGPPLAALLDAVLRAQPASASDTRLRSAARYARRLSSLLERPDQAAPPAAGLDESLTEREVEVLRLVEAGMTNREMSAELFVSVGTVKTHLTNLFRKLGAHSRTQALARARELGLVTARPGTTLSDRAPR